MPLLKYKGLNSELFHGQVCLGIQLAILLLFHPVPKENLLLKFVDRVGEGVDANIETCRRLMWV